MCWLFLFRPHAPGRQSDAVTEAREAGRHMVKAGLKANKVHFANVHKNQCSRRIIGGRIIGEEEETDEKKEGA